MKCTPLLFVFLAVTVTLSWGFDINRLTDEAELTEQLRQRRQDDTTEATEPEETTVAEDEETVADATTTTVADATTTTVADATTTTVAGATTTTLASAITTVTPRTVTRLVYVKVPCKKRITRYRIPRKRVLVIPFKRGAIKPIRNRRVMVIPQSYRRVPVRFGAGKIRG